MLPPPPQQNKPVKTQLILIPHTPLSNMSEEEDQHSHHRPVTGSPEEQMQLLRSKATELFLREEWEECVQVYSQFINLCQQHISEADHLAKRQKSLCLALANRAEVRWRLRDMGGAIKDCDDALKIESTHFKSLVCKGRILLGLNRYSMALDCFKRAVLDPQVSGNLETLNGYVERCKKLEFQSRTGAFDISDWILNGFRGKSPDMAEYIGAVQIKKSELSGRGLFATKNIDAGTLLLVTKAIATERCILLSGDSADQAQLVMWKNFIDKVVESATKCQRINHLISTLSTGEEEDELEVPEISLFKPDDVQEEESSQSNQELDKDKILSILDVNSLVEDSVSAKVLGKNGDYYGVGLWILASFINHSCHPNARRLHVGDYVLVHASRDVKEGEEITFAYFDVLSQLEKRKEMSKTWGFHCSCNRCKFEENVSCDREIKEIDLGLERGIDVGGGIFRLEEVMRRRVMRGKEKGFLRASFWAAYSEAYRSEKSVKRWGRRIPAIDAVVNSITEGIGSDERVLKVAIEGFKRSGASVMEMERVLRLGRGLYGKVVKKQAMRSILQLGVKDQSY